ncbi:MAG: hypothetical protein VX593_07585 [Pseudomonadota bacterium]|nr:hypothetical protein [Pseudomonadota bacterium]
MRTLIVMVMTVAFVVAPRSAAADSMHAGDNDTLICADAELSQDGFGEEPSHDGHEHKAHHCGSCHVHMIGGGDFGAAIQPEIQTKRLYPGQAAHASLGPDGLYRPPRA